MSNSNLVLPKIRNCARCGGSHIHVPIQRFSQPCRTHTHFATCPTTREPILVTVEDADESPSPKRAAKKEKVPYASMNTKQLNRAVAERLGWTDLMTRGHGKVPYGFPPGESKARQILRWATHMPDAWPLIEMLVNVHISIECVPLEGGHLRWGCRILEGNNVVWSDAAPRAVVEAWLGYTESRQ